MARMKRSTILLLIVIVMFLLVAIAGFTIPQEILDNYELIFLALIFVMGLLWILMYVDHTKGN